MQDFNDLVPASTTVLYAAGGVNEAGDIASDGDQFNNVYVFQRGFLLTPIQRK